MRARSLTVNRGRSDGIELQMPAVVPEGLVGRVAQVRSGASVVQLLNDPTSTVGAVVQRTRTAGLVEGEPSGGLRARNFIIEDSLVEGNEGSDGGGICQDFSNSGSELTRSVVHNNRARRGHGGGLTGQAAAKKQEIELIHRELEGVPSPRYPQARTGGDQRREPRITGKAWICRVRSTRRASAAVAVSGIVTTSRDMTSRANTAGASSVSGPPPTAASVRSACSERSRSDSDNMPITCRSPSTTATW